MAFSIKKVQMFFKVLIIHCSLALGAFSISFAQMDTLQVYATAVEYLKSSDKLKTKLPIMVGTSRRAKKKYLKPPVIPFVVENEINWMRQRATFKGCDIAFNQPLPKFNSYTIDSLQYLSTDSLSPLILYFSQPNNKTLLCEMTIKKRDKIDYRFTKSEGILFSLLLKFDAKHEQVEQLCIVALEIN